MTVSSASGRAMLTMVRTVRRLFRNALLVTKVVKVIKLRETWGRRPKPGQARHRARPPFTSAHVTSSIDDQGDCDNPLMTEQNAANLSNPAPHNHYGIT